MIKTKTPKLYLYNIDLSIPQTVHFGEHTYNRRTFLKYYKTNKKTIRATMYFDNNKTKIGTADFELFFPSSKFNAESDIYNYNKFTILFQNVQGRLMAFVVVDAE
jgi:hypothetical protein